MRYSVGLIVGFTTLSVFAAEKSSPPDFAKQIAPIFQKHCVGCHNPQDREGKLSLDSFADLQKGGKHGLAVQAGDLKSSRLYLMLTGEVKPAMPPEGEEPLKPEQIALIKAWIEAGATGPDGREPPRRELVVPQLPPAKLNSLPITAVATSTDGKLLSIARFGRIELRNASSLELIREMVGLPGKVNSIEFSADGQWIVAGSGVAGLFGQASLWNAATGKLVKNFEGHRDVLYDAVISPDSSLLATASYDRKIVLWDIKSGQQLRTLDGHNGAVFDLAFSPDGQILGSASADQTIKLWHVATGTRLDTLGQPLKEQYTVAFSPNGQYVVGGGLDNRIRVWKLLSREKPQINPLVFARFAHEGAVLRLAFTPDGRTLVSVADDQTLKLWETTEFTPVAALERQPDLTSALALSFDNRSAFVGRGDGTFQRYELNVKREAAEGSAAIVAHSPATAAPMKDVAETEPNDAPAAAQQIELPAKVQGKIAASREGPGDVDLFRFAAKAGDAWVFEVNAARNGSALDSKIEILDAAGRPIPRVLLQAMRDSYVTFRGIDSTTRDCRLHNWEEMDLNQYLYMNGEVVKLWLWPRGPDSGFVFYPHSGNRRTFFDTTATSHALNEPAYIVEPHPPGAKLLPNGLPTFTVHYENDDDSERELGSDSRLTFTAPSDGDYVIRIGDVRGFQGEKFHYELTARALRPDFAPKLNGANPTIGAGSGKEFSVTVDRQDGFDGEIRIDIEGLPPGFYATTPLYIQAGQNVAYGTLNATLDAPKPTSENSKTTKLTATAGVNGTEVKREVNNFGEIKLGDKPKILVAIGPDAPATTESAQDRFGRENPLELVIQPGRTITARVQIQRHGFEGRVGFEAIAQNLPHGVIIDNIGLNGLLIVEGQSERQFFLTAAPWVPETTRVFHLKANEEGGQSSWPIRLHVRRAK